MNGINIDTEGLAKLADELHTSREEVFEAANRINLAQIDLNKQEASHPSIFVSGWRPAFGWVCVAVVAFNYIGIWMIEYYSNFYDIPIPQRMSMSELWPVFTGMLGLAGSRSYEKANGVARESWGVARRLFKRKK